MFDNNHYHIQCDLRYHKLDFQYASSTCSTFTKGAHEDFEYYHVVFHYSQPWG